MVQILNAILQWLWIAVILVWIIGARMSKKRAATSSRAWMKGYFIRVGIAVLLVVLINTPAVRQSVMGLQNQAAVFDIAILRYGGFVLALLGIAFAVWARIQIGRNWGVPMSLRENHELVTGGPYAIVRHPIYTGLFFALFGSAFFYQSPVMLLVTAIFAIYYIFAARREERTMLEQFPDQYPAYRSRTKMLIPFIF